ncbi:MAG: hypothetical protein HY774_11740 [Acidobacteria bacterium]|nr:hypothetical protein [Acidobacteriota bacterium]
MSEKLREDDDSGKHPVIEDLPETPVEDGLVVESSKTDLVPIVRQGNIVRLSTDALSAEARAAIHAELAEESGQTFFIGRVENGYSLQSARHPDQCPQCQSPTKPHMASLIYATDQGPRVMTTRGVHFCTACPTVIVDEDMVERSMAEEFEYRGLLGLDFDGKAKPCFLKYWNGQEMVVLVDEETGFMELVPKNELKLSKPTMGKAPTRQVPKKKSGRTAMAKKSRKQNRKKK